MRIRFLLSIFFIWLITNICYGACNNFNPTSNQTSTCDSSPPNPITMNIAAVTGSTNVTVDILNGAIVQITRTTNPVAVSIDTTSVINNSGTVILTGGGGSGTNRGAALLGVNNGNQITNTAQGVISTTGAFNDGMAANGSNNSLINNGTITTTGPNAYGMTAAWGQTNVGQANNTFINTGTVTTNGTDARGISLLGGSGVVTNSGTVTTTGTDSNGVYMQGNNDSLINSGIIHTTGNVSSGSTNAVFSNTVGSSFTASIQNLNGGQIISDNDTAIRTLNGATSIYNAGLIMGGTGTAIQGGNGNVTLTLDTGSSIVGLANGGAGTNQVFLQGSGTITNPFINFQTLTMRGSAWVWDGTDTFANTFLQSGSFTLDNSLTGNVSISSGASLLAGNGMHPSIMPNIGGPPITVTNAGSIDLTNGATGPSDTLTIVGNYVGNNGVLNLQSTLGSDNSPSDQLIISGGTATGVTGLMITNVNGLGALDTGDGILVVQAINGATTDDAFRLAAPAAAGPYEYLLYKGGQEEGTSENWYLRSSLIDPPLSPSSPPVTITPTYRPETPVYSAIPPALYQFNLLLMDTFHGRRGEQSLLVCHKPLSEIWLRLFDQQNNQKWEGKVSPQLRGSVNGLQLGTDLLATELVPHHKDHAGFFVGYAHHQGDVRGFALAKQNFRAGEIYFDSESFGAYWTHVGPSSWYLDGVLLNNWYKGRARSFRGNGIGVSEQDFTASLEGGYPLFLTSNVQLEPQTQIIWQQMPTIHRTDKFSDVIISATNGWTGRVGARLQGNFEVKTRLFQPYLRANLWHNFPKTDTVTFATTPITTENRSSSLQLGGGVVYAFTRTIGAFLTAEYAFNVDGERQRIFSSNAGIQVVWR